MKAGVPCAASRSAGRAAVIEARRRGVRHSGEMAGPATGRSSERRRPDLHRCAANIGAPPAGAAPGVTNIKSGSRSGLGAIGLPISPFAVRGGMRGVTCRPAPNGCATARWCVRFRQT